MRIYIYGPSPSTWSWKKTTSKYILFVILYCYIHVYLCCPLTGGDKGGKRSCTTDIIIKKTARICLPRCIECITILIIVLVMDTWRKRIGVHLLFTLTALHCTLRTTTYAEYDLGAFGAFIFM